MQQEHRDAIQSNFTSLVERTDLDSVVTALYEKGVFSEAMIEPYRDTNITQRERKRRLYRDITRRGPHAFEHLLDVLSEVGHWDIVRDLDPTSPYHRNTSTIPNRDFQPLVADENSFVSLSTEKNQTKNEMQKTTTQPEKLPTREPVKMPTFEVIKSTKFIEEDDSKDEKLYYTRGKRRGLLLIFSYVVFDNDIEPARNGVDVDTANLKHLFSEMGFKVMLSQNETKENTLATLRSVKELVSGVVESVFVVVSSHGYETSGSDTHIRCSDGKHLSIYEIIEYFNNKNLPALVGVPKVFIFQTCRGDSRDYVWRENDVLAPPHMPMPDNVASDGMLVQPQQHSSQRSAARALDARRTEVGASYSDILIAHSTLPGFVSHRDKTMGSWYIQVLCEVFAARAHDCHVLKLLTLVDIRLQERFKVQTSSIDKWGFNKRLYLYPGLYE